MINKNRRFQLSQVQRQIDELEKEKAKIVAAISRDIKKQVYEEIQIFKSDTGYYINIGDDRIASNLPEEAMAIQTRVIIANAFVQNELKGYI